MKILFIGKRHPQQRDLLLRPYGRFFHLPVELAALGHQVHAILCSHRNLPSTDMVARGVDWISRDLRALGPRGLLRQLRDVARAVRPDWVIGVSDAQFGVLAQIVASSCDARLAIDAYDNYEAYMPWNLPLHLLWRRSIRHAELVTAAGPQLAAHLQAHRPADRAVAVVPMAADPEFQPQDKAECRERLGLPIDSPLVGYTGSWASRRGTEVLMPALRTVRRSRPDARLVLCGRLDGRAPAEPGVMPLGYVDDNALPPLVSALDVACVITADTAFGRYSYPAKLCEAMACAVPVAATETEPVQWMLGNRSRHLARLGDSASLARCIIDLLDSPTADYGPLPTWSHCARLFDRQLAS